jgi:hypothetical protein
MADTLDSRVLLLDVDGVHGHDFVLEVEVDLPGELSASVPFGEVVGEDAAGEEGC